MSRRIECPHPHLCGVKSHEPERGAIVECQRKGRGFTVTDRRGSAHLGDSLKVNSAAVKTPVAELPSEDDILDMLDEDDYTPEPTFSQIIGDDTGRHVVGREPSSPSPVAEATEQSAPAQEPAEEPVTDASAIPVAADPAAPEDAAAADEQKVKLGKDATRAAQEIGRDARRAGPTVLDPVEDGAENLIPDGAEQLNADPTAQLQMASCPNPDVCGSQQHIVGSLSHQLCQRLSIKLAKMSQPAVPAITPRPVQDLAKYHRAGEVIAQAVRKAPRNAAIGVGLGLVASIAFAGPLFLPVMGAYFAFQGARYGWAAYRAANPGDDFAGTVTKIAAGMVAQRMSQAEQRNDPQETAPEADGGEQVMSDAERERLNDRLEELFTRYDKMDEEFVEIANEYGGVQQLQQMLNSTEDRLARA